MPLEARRGLQGFEDDLRAQAAYWAERGHQTYAGLLGSMESRLDGDAALRPRFEAAWAERSFSSVYERPLLVCASLRFGALLDERHPLRAFIGDEADGKAPIPGAALDDALREGAPFWSWLSTRFVQTNETTRAVAWRLALGALWPEAAAQPPLVLVDLGCSAGLNLVGDRLPMVWRDAAGAPLALAHVGRIRARLGLDRAPADVGDARQATWLRACLWPGQHARLARFDAALGLARAAAAAGELRVEACEAGAFPAVLDRICAEQPDAFVLAYQTVMIEYLEPAVRAAFEEGMGTWLDAHRGRAAWCRLEGAPRHLRQDALPAAIDVALRRASAAGGIERFVLARCEWHPEAVHVDAAAVADAANALRRA